MAKQNRNWNQQREDNWSWDNNRDRDQRYDDSRNREQYGNYGNVGYGYNSNNFDNNRNDRRNNEWRSNDWRDNDWRNNNDRMNSGYGSNNQNYGSSQYRSAWDRGDEIGEGKFGMNYGREDFGRRDAGYMNDYGNRGGYRNDSSNSRPRRDWWDKTVDEVSSWFGDDEARRRRERDERSMGGHRGKGPKEYKRSQERIQEDVNDRLSDDDYVDASDIQVQVLNNEVILTGSVKTREQKRRAEDLVESVSGVHNVENRIKVSRDENNTVNDVYSHQRTTTISDDVADSERNRIV